MANATSGLLKVTVAEATADDIPEVMALELSCFPDPWDRQGFDRELVNPFSHFLVARDPEGHLAGYVIYWAAGPEYHLVNLAVRPDVRRRGVARTLMNRCLQDARASGAEYVVLEVRVSNIPAKTLYKFYGFVTISTRRRYYRNGEDAEIMLLDLGR